MSSPAPRAKEACRWKERRIGWEIHVGDYGWRLRVGLVEKTARGRGGGGVKMFDRHEEDEMGKERSGGSGEDDRGQLTLKLDVL